MPIQLPAGEGAPCSLRTAGARESPCAFEDGGGSCAREPSNGLEGGGYMGVAWREQALLTTLRGVAPRLSLMYFHPA